MALTCKQASLEGTRARVSFRVYLSRNFSRLPQWEACSQATMAHSYPKLARQRLLLLFLDK